MDNYDSFLKGSTFQVEFGIIGYFLFYFLLALYHLQLFGHVKGIRGMTNSDLEVLISFYRISLLICLIFKSTIMVKKINQTKCILGQ